MFDPPPSEFLLEAYQKGYEAAKNGLTLDDNPYPPSGHPRDTTYQDELNYQWYSGFCDFSD